MARGVVGPAVLAGLVMVFVYTAAGALLGAVAVTVSPGPDTAGGVWDALVWALAVALAALAARPILRRVARRVAVGTGGGILLAVAYGAVTVYFGVPGAPDALLGAQLVAMVAAGVLVGAWTAPRSGEGRAGEPGS